MFAINKAGSYFGDIDFTLSTTESEASRLYTVKAMSDVSLLALHKQDLYEIDIKFKKEIF